MMKLLCLVLIGWTCYATPTSDNATESLLKISDMISNFSQHVSDLQHSLARSQNDPDGGIQSLIDVLDYMLRNEEEEPMTLSNPRLTSFYRQLIEYIIAQNHKIESRYGYANRATELFEEVAAD